MPQKPMPPKITTKKGQKKEKNVRDERRRAKKTKRNLHNIVDYRSLLCELATYWNNTYLGYVTGQI